MEKPRDRAAVTCAVVFERTAREVAACVVEGEALERRRRARGAAAVARARSRARRARSPPATRSRA